MCLYPKLILNPKYKSNKKNGGNIPAVNDIRVKYVPIGCQRCIECKKKKAREWQIRLSEEIKTNKNGKFITLTFSNESIKKIICEQKLEHLEGYELDNEIATKAVRLFLERWRKKYKKSLRHWLITELGHNGTENVHLHGIIFTNESYDTVRKLWTYGYIWPRGNSIKTYVNNKTINYIIKYVNKADEKHKYYNSKILTSPGIGSEYTKKYNSTLNKYNGKETNETYRTESGHKIGIPIYYRNKLYTEEEREKLWLDKLDKNERYVCGQKIKADNTEEYEKLLEYHRNRSKILGYGNDEKDWNREQYELERRKINYETRKKTLRGLLPEGG